MIRRFTSIPNPSERLFTYNFLMFLLLLNGDRTDSIGNVVETEDASDEAMIVR